MGTKAKVDPTLILAIMAIESSFNPFAQSSVGAQGLMQVMTQVHDEKYSAFGGSLAAFDPLTNLRVGVQVLRECIAKAGGDVELGLKFYVGAANLPTDGGYADKVMGERAALLDVAAGVNLASTAVTQRAPLPPSATPNGGTLVAAAKLDRPADMQPAPAHAGAAKSGAVPVVASSAVAPAAHAASGTVMAPAIGAALVANLSATAEGAAAAVSPAGTPVKKPVAPVQADVLAAKPAPALIPAAARSASPVPDLAANLPALRVESKPPVANPVPAAAPASPRALAPKTNGDAPSTDGRVAMAVEPLR